MNPNPASASRRPSPERAALILFALGGWSLFLVGAASDNTDRIGVVDPVRVTGQSKTIQAALSKASADVKRLSKELEAKREEFLKATEAYGTQKSATSEEENAKRLERLKVMKEELDGLSQKTNEAFQKAGEEAVGPNRDRIVGAVKAVAVPKGVGVVFNVENTVFYDPALDLTDAVIAALDKK